MQWFIVRMNKVIIKVIMWANFSHSAFQRIGHGFSALKISARHEKSYSSESAVCKQMVGNGSKNINGLEKNSVWQRHSKMKEDYKYH